MTFSPYEKISSDDIYGCAASAVIVNDKKQVLLLMRDDYPVWVNIGGLVDPGENFEQAMHRETMEESHLKVRVVREGGEYFTALSPPLKGYMHEKLYYCIPADDKQVARLGNDGVRVEWFDIDKLPANIPPSCRMRIEETFYNRPASTYAGITMPDMRAFAATLKPEQIYGYEMWKAHPKVIAKQAKANPSRLPRSSGGQNPPGF